MPIDLREPDLDLALHHVIRCALEDKPCAALLDELRRLYAAAGEPLPYQLKLPLEEVTAQLSLDDQM
jgi:hypothetical protein